MVQSIALIGPMRRAVMMKVSRALQLQLIRSRSKPLTYSHRSESLRGWICSAAHRVFTEVAVQFILLLFIVYFCRQ